MLDAAEITQTGRAYLQVGNNEVYELFQSAWSGADYQPDKDDMGIEDHTIYLINELGQYEILNEDLSGLEEAEEIKEVPTELDAIVQHIQVLCQEQEIPPVPQPWLPPLKERIALEELEAVQPAVTWEEEKPLSFLLGMADIPQAQKQEAISINLSKDGHVLLYGSPGTGKTTFLQTAGMDLARKHSPKALTMYLMDFGTNGLAPLSNLPQVADTMLLDQAEKISKFVRIMERELNRRKKLLADYGVGTLELYREASGQQEPAIVIFLDSYEAIKEEAYEAEVFKLLVRISREGLSIGVHLLMTAGRQSNLRAQLYSNFKHQLSLPQNDVSEVRSIVGSTPLAMTMEDIKGRALMKRDEVDVIQLALPVAGANDAQVLNNLRQEVASLQEAWTGQRPSAIPMVPEELTEADFYSRASVQAALQAGQIPLGLDIETVMSRQWNPKLSSLLYLYDKDSDSEQFINFIKREADVLGIKVALVMPENSMIGLDLENMQIYDHEEDYKEMLAALDRQIASRQKEKHRETTHIIIWYRYEEVISQINILQHELVTKLFDKGYQVGLANIVLASPAAMMRQQDMPSRSAKAFKQVLLGMRIQDQMVITPINRPSREVALKQQEHYMVIHGQASKIQVIIK